ncbi:MAG: phospholipase D family protein [Gammaproteobacteria bacterium]|nr:MAG: phospholipase D family protein [Gammaproteobacteria bacterium]
MYLLNEGTNAFFARMSLVELAERSIDVQYYIWRADLVGKLLFNAMLKAADRGVRVRILLDDISTSTEVEGMLYAMDQHENIEVRLYNPFASRTMRFVDYVLDGFRINRRMHNKSFSADEQMTIVGGRNIGNEYFSADKNSNFSDLDVLSAGPIVNEVGVQFDIYWNSKVVFPVKVFSHNNASADELNKLKKELVTFAAERKGSSYDLDVQDSEVYRRINNVPGAKKARLFHGEMQVIYDDPAKGLGRSETEVVYLKTLLRPHLEKVIDSFELISPYFVPGDRGTEYLTNLVKKGVKVRALTNSLSSTDGILAQSGYARQRLNLLRGGVELYEIKSDIKTDASRSLRRGAKAKSALHTKTYIFDRKEIFIGSFNFDPRSANINSEVGVVYSVPEMAELIGSSVFDEAVKEHAYKVELVDDGGGERIVWVETKDGKEIRYTKDPETSAWRRFNESVYSILPIESQL